MTIPIFKAEREAGLDAAIQAQASLCFASLAEPLPDVETDVAVVRTHLAIGGIPQHLNLHAFKSLLVSVGWNKNDDVFDKQEVWAARATPEDQPINIEHDSTKIRGHITGQYPVNAKMERLADDLTVDELPDKYHIVTSGVLYKHYEDEDVKKEMTAVISELAEGKWYVSMECLLRGFDYAVISPSGKASIVPRQEESAFLTKHLRAYGGSGKYDGYRVGRLLRNFSFSGKGLVRKPANPESVILAEANEFVAKPQEFSKIFVQSGYSTSTDIKLESNSMPTELDINKLESQLKAAIEEKNQALAALKEVESQKLTDMQEQLKALSTEAEAQKVKASELATELANTKTELDSAKAELAKLEAEAKQAKRVSLLKDKLGESEEGALKLAATMANLTDEQFVGAADYMAEKMAEFKKAANQPKVDEQDEGEGHPTAPGLHTSPAKQPEKKSVKTVEVNGSPRQSADKPGTSKVGPMVTANEDVETDPNERAAAANLDNATPEPDAKLAAAAEADAAKIEATRASIWDFMKAGNYMKHAPKRATE